MMGLEGLHTYREDLMCGWVLHCLGVRRVSDRARDILYGGSTVNFATWLRSTVRGEGKPRLVKESIDY